MASTRDLVCCAVTTTAACDPRGRLALMPGDAPVGSRHSLDRRLVPQTGAVPMPGERHDLGQTGVRYRLGPHHCRRPGQLGRVHDQGDVAADQFRRFVSENVRAGGPARDEDTVEIDRPSPLRAGSDLDDTGRGDTQGLPRSALRAQSVDDRGRARPADEPGQKRQESWHVRARNSGVRRTG